MRWTRREWDWPYVPQRGRRSLSLPLWLAFGLPAMIVRTVMGAVWGGVGGAAGVTAGVFAALLGIAIAVPVVAFVLGLILALIPLVMAAVALAAAFAVVTWPVRFLLWLGSRDRGRRWIHEDPWEEERWHG